MGYCSWINGAFLCLFYVKLMPRLAWESFLCKQTWCKVRTLAFIFTVLQINDWLDKMKAYCGSKCRIHNIGSSGEGRQLKVIQIGSLTRRNIKGAVWIEAGIHAREWIAPATANNIINKVSHYSFLSTMTNCITAVRILAEKTNLSVGLDLMLIFETIIIGKSL